MCSCQAHASSPTQEVASCVQRIGNAQRKVRYGNAQCSARVGWLLPECHASQGKSMADEEEAVQQNLEVKCALRSSAASMNSSCMMIC